MTTISIEITQGDMELIEEAEAAWLVFRNAADGNVPIQTELTSWAVDSTKLSVWIIGKVRAAQALRRLQEAAQ